MPFDWEEYSDVAYQLTKAPTEGNLRTAVSRIYYSALHAAKAHLEAETGRRAPKQGTHEWVWGQYQASADLDRRAIAAEGFRCHRKRNKADYDDELPGLSSILNETFSHAKEIKWLLKSI